MSKATTDWYEILEEAGQVLGEVAGLLEAEGKEDLPLTRRVRRTHQRLLGKGQENAPSGEPGTSKPSVEELEATCRTQHAALERIASGVQPSRGDQGPTMLTVREARAIAQSALHLSVGDPKGRIESERSPVQEAEQLRASILSGDLQGAKRQAQMILERDEMLDVNDPRALLVRTFAQTLLGSLEGKIGMDVRRTATSSLVRREHEARQAAERHAGQIERECAELRRALAWYAEKANYRATPEYGQQEILDSAVEHDQGRRARQALDDSEAGCQVARHLQAAKKLIDSMRTELETYEREIAERDTRADDIGQRS